MPNDVVKMQSVPRLPAEDIPVLLSALVSDAQRIQSISLSCGTVWIKRHGDKGRRAIVALQAAIARALHAPFMRPSPATDGEGMVARDLRRMQRLTQQGIPTATILYTSGNTIVLSDVAPTVERRLASLRTDDPSGHDDLLVFCCGELGQLHSNGLCHGRPFPRDMYVTDGRLGYIDFEEEPEAVMPLPTAQARDIWLFFLQLSDRAINRQSTQNRAYEAWSKNVSPATIDALGTMTRTMGRFLWLARLIGRIHMGRDLRQFILATAYLTTVFHG